MTLAHRAAALTPLDAALAAVLEAVKPVACRDVPLAEALGCIAAEMPPVKAHPVSDLAATDGWAFCSGDLVGASPWSPLLLTASPVWVEAGDRMPTPSDCVIDCDAVEQTGAVFQVSAEAIPGQGVRRRGGEIA